MTDQLIEITKALLVSHLSNSWEADEKADFTKFKNILNAVLHAVLYIVC